MIKEYIKLNTKETVVKIQNTQVSAVRTKDILKKGVRVYKDNLIGISGAIGDVEDGVLVEQAIDNLKTNIKYPYKVSEKLVDKRNYTEGEIKPSEVKKIADNLVETLSKQYDQYSFSHMISLKEQCIQMCNTEGLDLEYKDTILNIGLLLKDKTSANLFDGYIGYGGRHFDMDKFWEFNHSYLKAYDVKSELPKGDKVPVFMVGNDELLGFLSKHLNGENFATKSSIFAEKMNETLFNEKIVIEHSLNPKYTNRAFFDMEGVVMNDDKTRLVENGKLICVSADKKTSIDYKLPHTGGATGAYDDRPSLSHMSLKFETDTKDIKEVLQGQLGILVVVNSGGDYTPDGSYASPVQVAFLFDGEKIIGKLDEFSINSHLYDMLGDDYIGTFDCDNFYFGDEAQLQGYYMNIVR